MDIVPKLIAGIFLFRTLKTPLIRITNVLAASSTPLIALCFFLLGELGLSSAFKVIFILFLILGSKGIQPLGIQNLKEGFTIPSLAGVTSQLKAAVTTVANVRSSLLSTIINGVAFLTGWCVKSNVGSLPIDSLVVNLWSRPLLGIFVLVFLVMINLHNHLLATIVQLTLLSLFLGANHLSFVFLFVFVLAGLLTRRNRADIPFLSFFIIEATLTVGTLFTTTPANIVFGIGSILLVWKLADLNDAFKIKQKNFLKSNDQPSDRLQRLQQIKTSQQYRDSKGETVVNVSHIVPESFTGLTFPTMQGVPAVKDRHFARRKDVSDNIINGLE